MLKKPISANEQPQQPQSYEPYWSEHITTLMAIQVQFVFHKRPGYDQSADSDRKNKKRKSIEYESGFLFSGRRQDKQTAGKVEELVMSSHCEHLKKLFAKNGPEKKREGMYVLQKMVKIMLSLKHSTIVRQFIELYEEVIKKIVKIDFSSLRQDEPRKAIVDKLAQQISRSIKSNSRQGQSSGYKHLSQYLVSKQKDTLQFLRAVVYCFMGELHNFNINEYYMQAFTFEQQQKKVAKKKRKLQ